MRSISDTLARMAAYQHPIGLASATPSRLAPFEDFGANPGALAAHVYIPPQLAPGAPLVVALHGCTQTAADYDLGTGWSTLADAAGFALLLPEQRRANNANLCFGWFEPGDIARHGGEAESIAQMVTALVARHGLDPRRIFVTGLSAGGAMTAVMLATYPELFAAGAIIGGLPYGGASGVAQALDRMRGHGAASDAEAADAVRAAAPGATRSYPAVSIWQGGSDTTVVAANADRLVGQWRTVHGLPAVPSETKRGTGWEHKVWRDRAGGAAVEQWSIAAMGHGVPIDPTGAAALGEAGPYMLDVGLSSTQAIAASWGLVAVDRRARTAHAPPPSGKAPSVQVRESIERAMRSAGLLR
ncbi:PHB depolymerase family esterase [Sphingomonas sp. RB3P16]|uniref:extracellular catalytic domain type 1 short-chain-length polyhydroxyalkanoate depolymerase n=1 Tax=Parasphingomonas frigoris TaxID=3096163 RepID=UPI002FC7690C